MIIVTRNRLHAIYKKIIPALSFVIFISCASAPHTVDPVRDESAGVPLESGASVYIFADVKEARPILDILNIPELKNAQARQMMDRSNSAVIAFFPETNERRFQLAAWGSYPSGGANMALGLNKDWKKLRAGTEQYWYSAASKLSISMFNKQAFVTSWSGDQSGTPLAATVIESPEGFNNFRRGAVLSLWMDDPGPRINKIVAGAGLPLQVPADRIFVSLFHAAGDKYEAAIKVIFSSPSQARAFFAIFNLARAFMPPPDEADSTGLFAALLFANPPVLEGRDLNLRTSALGIDGLALLLKQFLIR